MKKRLLALTILASASLATVGFKALAQEKVVFVSYHKAGTAGTWTEGSCYGDGTSCKVTRTFTLASN